MDALLPDSLWGPPSSESVNRVVAYPRVFGFCGDSRSYARVKLTTLASSQPPGALIDGGANICLTGDLAILTDVVAIPPMPISVALQGETTLDNCCTARGKFPLQLDDGSIYWQDCYYSKHAVETIISPQAIVDSSDVFHSWQQTGFRIGDTTPGRIRFDSHDGLVGMSMTLVYHEGLHYCPTNVCTLDHTPATRFSPALHRVARHEGNTPITRPARSRFVPTSKAKQVESEVWLLRLGSPGVRQLDLLPGSVTGIPTNFRYHPFHYIDHKEQASIKKIPAQPSSVRTTERKRRFYMDFGFMRASTTDYSRPNKSTDRVAQSYDGYTSYLLIIDEASRFAWVFLTKSKDPPLDIVRAFLRLHGHEDGGCIRTDQGGELASSYAFGDLLLTEFNYTLEPTGADSPSQNGAVEIYNGKLGIRTRTLLYGSGLPAKYWSAALIHAVYLHNRLVHSVTLCTPFESYYSMKPDLQYLKTFGSRVCVKRTGDRRAKLDRHDFSGIFLGYTSTDQNILYLDLHSGLVKRSHHATFDEAWYLQPTRPPAAQLLYDLGLEAETVPVSETGPDIESLPESFVPLPVPWPPPLDFCTSAHKWVAPSGSRMIPLPLRETSLPRPISAAAARLQAPVSDAASIVTDYGIGKDDMAVVYMSPDPFFDAFEEDLDLRKWSFEKHRTAGLSFVFHHGRLYLGGMVPGTPGAKVDRWRTNLRGAWLIKIGGTRVSTIQEAQLAFQTIYAAGSPSVTLLFAHPELRRDISNKGLPIVSSAPFTQQTHDQLNRRWDFATVAEYLNKAPPYKVVASGDVLNYVTRVMKLTRGKLLRQEDWNDWQESEFLQLNQYDAQNMFGSPVAVESTEAVFNLVWSYGIKAVDGRKKARCTCDGSTRSGQVRVLDETYANCVDQTSARLFYGIAAAENLIVYGADVSNAFAEAPPPKQGFYIRPDKAFHTWWTRHKQRPPIPPGHMIPILSAMQGHPESPRLWEKHADAILRELGLTPTVHEPCLYSGTINGKRILFMRQVDDFAIGAPDAHTADVLLDMLDDRLTIPIKRQGHLDMYNGVDILQTRHYVRLSCTSFIEKISEKYLATWMKHMYAPSTRPTPLPTDHAWWKEFNKATGDPDVTVQTSLAKEMQLSYRAGVGELIWAMTTCRPDLAFASVKLSQSNSCPHKIHYHGLKHCLKYLFSTKEDGLFFWRTSPRMDLAEGPIPPIQSNKQDLLLDNRPDHGATVAHAYADSDWATCVKTRRSFGGSCLRLAGGTVAYKTQFQPTVAGSSTEAEYMSAYFTGKMILFVRSVLWDLGIPQEAATLLYEDNDACTAMANAQKPTPRTRHMDIKYFSLSEWVERDLMLLARIDTSINLADHFTKGLHSALFHRHADFILGHIPPAYSPVYRSIIGSYARNDAYLDKFVPSSFTTPTTAAAARVHAPLLSDYADNPWIPILGHGLYNPLVSMSSV